MALTQVSTSGVKDGSINTADLADDAVTGDKLNNTGVSAGSYTLSSITVDAQGRVTAASSGTPVDADKIIEGNTEVEAVDTGSDGHIKATTEGSERFRVGPAGQMGIGGANYGTSGQVLMSGGASAAPTWGDVSSSPTFEATASGAIADGKPVIIKTDGTVEQAGLSTNPITTLTEQSRSQFETAFGVESCVMGYDPDTNQFLVVYRDNASSYFQCRLCSFNASTGNITVNSRTQISNTNRFPKGIAYDTTNNKFCILYRFNNDLKAREVFISGTNITFGEESNITGSTSHEEIVYDPDTDQFVVIFRKSASPDYQQRCRAITGQRQGSNNFITWSSTVTAVNSHVVTSGGDRETGVAYDTNANKLVVVQSVTNGSTDQVVATVGTVSSGSVSFGTPVDVTNYQARHPCISYNVNAQKLVVAYERTSPYSLRSRVGTVSGTSISFGTEVTIANSGESNQIVMAYDSHTYKTTMCYLNHANSGRLGLNTGTISGTSISWGTTTHLQGNSVSTPYLAYDDDQQRMGLCMRLPNSSNRGDIVCLNTTATTTNLTVENYVGISNAAYSNGQTATIQTFGAVDDAQSGLTAGQKYYVQANGTLGLNQTEGTGTMAGIALSGTKLLISGN